MEIQVTSPTDTPTATPKDAIKSDESKASGPKSAQTQGSVSENTEESDTSNDVEGDGNEAEANDKEANSDSDEQDEESEGKPKKASGFEKRIKRFQKKLSEKDKEIEYLKSIAFEAKGKPEATKAGTAKDSFQAKTKEGRPNPDDFETHEDFVDALTDWKIGEREKEREVAAKHTQIKSEYQGRVESFRGKVETFAKSHEDFNDVLEEVDDIPMSMGVQEALLDSEVGADVMYELAKNRKEYERINSLGVSAAAREIGRLEERIQSRKKAKQEAKTTTTSAPNPLTPVGKGGNAKSAKSVEDMSFEEYKEYRLKKA